MSCRNNETKHARILANRIAPLLFFLYEQQAGGPEFTVTIVACGPVADGGLVYAVTVTQPVQSWTVVRSHDDFRSLGVALSSALAAMPSCPLLDSKVATGDLNVVLKARNELQSWLSTILMYPGAQESPALSTFLTQGANTVPTQYEGVAWTQFNQVLPPVPSPSSPTQASSQGATGNVNVNVDDMEMDDMFLAGDDGAAAPQDNNEDEDEYNFEDIPSASERYKQTDEAFTEEDEMEILQCAGEVEMIDDIGSLAQSLGASHLGRSLQLQAQMKHRENKNQQQHKPQQGLNIGGSSAHPAPVVGGLGGAMERAANSAHFNHKPPVSAPRLDSFKMIKVIGKGSFGKHGRLSCHYCMIRILITSRSNFFIPFFVFAGKVFLVKEIKTGEIFALKVLRKDNIIKRNQVEHTNTERSVLGYVRHPFIVGMNMAFQSKDKLYFVLDYCAGGELFFHLGKLGKFPEPRARFYAAEIILAISYVHTLDIIYRDLKPENVLLDAQGHIRLTDFGLSKEGISSSSSGAHSFCGKSCFIPPIGEMSRN